MAPVHFVPPSTGASRVPRGMDPVGGDAHLIEYRRRCNLGSERLIAPLRIRQRQPLAFSPLGRSEVAARPMRHAVRNLTRSSGIYTRKSVRQECQKRGGFALVAVKDGTPFEKKKEKKECETCSQTSSNDGHRNGRGPTRSATVKRNNRRSHLNFAFLGEDAAANKDVSKGSHANRCYRGCVEPSTSSSESSRHARCGSDGGAS